MWKKKQKHYKSAVKKRYRGSEQKEGEGQNLL